MASLARCGSAVRRCAWLAGALALAASLTVAQGARAATPLAGGDACELVEGLPGPRDPLRLAGPYAGPLRQLAKAGSDPRRLARAHRALAGATARLMAQARTTFHPKGGKVDRARARRFLERFVLGRSAVLEIVDDRFAPVRGVWAAQIVAACRSGASDAALAVARGGSARDPSLAALAALMLLDAGRPAQAEELAPRLTREGFLAPYVMAELSRDPATRQEAHAIATRRVTTPAQQLAVARQARRLAAPPGPAPRPQGAP
jgi:hypothetical protein